jgi:hypothetical protein
VNDINKLKQEVEKILFEVNSESAIVFDPSKDDLLLPNYTVNCFFDDSDLENINSLAGKLRQIDPNQLFYNLKQLHITLQGEVDMNSNKDQIIKIVQDFLNTNKIEFHLLGVGSSKKVASVTAYPVNFDIARLRQKIRRIGGGTKFDGPYERLAWINFMRFLEKPKGELLIALRDEIDTDFGIVKLKAIQLLKNSSRLLKNAEVAHNFII